MSPRLSHLLHLLKPTNLLATILLVGLGIVGVTLLRIHLRSGRVDRRRQELEEAVGQLQDQNKALRETVASLEAQCEQLRTFVARLTTESRVAEVRILASHPDRAGVPLTTFEFTEFGPDARPLRSRVFATRGHELYFDALVIKFADDRVKVGDPLRGKSVHLFRRVFGSAQEPRDGPLLAASETDGVPDAYRSAPETSEFERRLWRLFWHWAAHPDEAAAEGVRVAQIEAVGIRPIVGAAYRLTLRHAGGLDIRRVLPKP